MKNKRFADLILAVLVLGSAAGADPGGSVQITSPPGFSFADAQLDEHGSGYVLWKDVEGLRTVLERLENQRQVKLWRLEGYVAKGLRVEADRVLLQGQDGNGRRLQVVEPGTAGLKVVWDSRELVEAAHLQGSELSVSADLRWWYAAEYEETTVRVRAGRLGEDEARFRWVVDVVRPDGFLTGLADLPSRDSLRLALAVNGEGWLLLPDSNAPLSLEKPAACSEIFTVTASADGFWATCGGGVRVLYPADGPEGGQQGIAPRAVTEAANLRILPDGTTTIYERKHGRSGTLQLLRWEDGVLRRSAAVPYPVPLGQVGHLAGSMVLLRVSAGHPADKSASAERYRLLPLDLTRASFPWR